MKKEQLSNDTGLEQSPMVRDYKSLSIKVFSSDTSFEKLFKNN